MTVVERDIDADCERVFDMLSDGWVYPVWVVGATHVQQVDEAWPAAGTRIRHQVGAWPMMVSDYTQSLAEDRPRHLQLRVRAWPAGAGVVELELTATNDRCRLRMGERPTGGPARWLDNPLMRLMLKARNRECLARLAVLAERRDQP